MAQVLSVFHTGFYTLRQGEVRLFSGTTLVLPDSAAILEKGLEAPFIPQDRPPLAIAMASDSAGGIGLSWPIGGNYDYPHEQLKGFPTRQQKT